MNVAFRQQLSMSLKVDTWTSGVLKNNYIRLLLSLLEVSRLFVTQPASYLLDYTPPYTKAYLCVCVYIYIHIYI